MFENAFGTVGKKKKTWLRFCHLELENCRVWWVPAGGRLHATPLTFKVYESNTSVQTGTQKAFLSKQQLIRQQSCCQYTNMVIIIQASSGAKKKWRSGIHVQLHLFFLSTCIHKQIQSVRCRTLCPKKMVSTYSDVSVVPPAQQVDLLRIRAKKGRIPFFSSAAWLKKTWNVTWLADQLSKRAPSGPPISLQAISWLAECWDDGQHIEVVAVTAIQTLLSKNNWFSSCLLTAWRSHDGFMHGAFVQLFFVHFLPFSDSVFKFNSLTVRL